MSDKNVFDAIVVGSGMSGGWAAKEFTGKGFKTLVLERGRDVKHLKDYPTTNMMPWEFQHRNQLPAEITEANPVVSRCYAFREDAVHFFVKDTDHPYIQDKPFDWIRGYQVGGKSLLWARQLYNLNNEVQDTQVRMLEKVANLLTPEFLTSASPAHGILRVMPAEPVEVLSITTSFSTQKKISSKQNEPPDTNLDVFFTPVNAVQIYDCQITLIKTGENLYEYDQNLNKRVKARTPNEKVTEKNTLWLGLKMNPGIKNINDLYFCFDWKNIETEQAGQIYQLLPLTKWYVNNEELRTATGIPYVVDSKEGEAYNYKVLDHDLLTAIENDIKHYCDSKFIHITDKSKGDVSSLKETYPSSFKSSFAENDVEQLKDKLLWVKIVFPAAVEQRHLDEVHIYLNAFPIVNRQLTKLNFRLKGGSNIVPLKTSMLQQFLSVKSLSDDTYKYHSVPYRKMEQEQRGTYTLRNGGVERFDTRNARELMSYLLELIRSESAAFSAYGYDFIATILKEMNQRMVLIEEKTNGSVNNATEIPNYIIVKPIEGQDMMYVEYWTTLAEAANNIRSGTQLQQVSGAKVKNTMALMTTTIGGKNRLRPEERLNAFRYGFMTRNRIITKEDIKNFCFFELGSRIKNIVVEKGYEMSANPQHGFTRTINVALHPSDKETLNNAEWQMLCDQLKSKLETRSGMSNHYRISVSL